VLKQQLCLGIAGLAAGLILASLQSRELTITHKPPSVSTSKRTVGNPACQFPMPEALQLHAVTDPLSATPAPSHPQSAALIPTPDVLVAAPIPDMTVALPELLPGNNRVYAEPPLLDERDFWNRFVDVASDKTNVGWEKLDVWNKKSDANPFQTLDVSNMSNIGAACRLIENEDTMFRGRLAGGVSRDYAGLGDAQRIPEVLLGFQFEHQLSQRNKIVGGVEYAHDVTEFGRYRVRTQAAWEVLLAADKNVSLRTGILETANRAPSGEQARNRDCSLDVIWRF
jgi:hypothetical protein